MNEISSAKRGLGGTSLVSEDESGGLSGHIGILDVVFLVVAAAAPLTAIGGALPVMLAIGNGAGTPMAFLVVGAVLLVFSVGYAAMSAHVTEAGAFYAYVTRGLGRNTGLGAAGLALLAYTTIQAGIYGLAATTLQGLVERYGGPHLTWWLWAAVLMAIVAFLGYRNINVGARILSVLIVLEIGAIGALSAAVLVRGGAHGIDATSFTPTAFFSGAPGIGVMFAVASFIGFEATAIYGQEARNPRRTVPVATYLAVTIIGLFYAISSWAVVLAFGSKDIAAAAQADTSGLTFSAATTYLGSAASDIMQILLMTSLFAALLAFHNAISRYLHALGRAGDVPVALGRAHLRHRSPHVGSIAQTVSAIVVVGAFAVTGADPILQLFTWMSGLTTVAMLLLMVLVSLAVLAFFVRSGLDRRWWNTKIAPVLGSAGLIAITFIVLSNFTTLISGSTALAVSLLLVVVLAFVGGIALGAFSGRRAGAREAGGTSEVRQPPG